MNLYDFLSDSKSEIISLFAGAVMATIVIIGIVGRNKFTWFIKELSKMYYAKETSIFGKKRLESGVAYVIFQCGMIFWLTKCVTATDFGAWAIIEAGVSGWTVTQIQKEKKMNMGNDSGGDNGAAEAKSGKA